VLGEKERVLSLNLNIYDLQKEKFTLEHEIITTVIEGHENANFS